MAQPLLLGRVFCCQTVFFFEERVPSFLFVDEPDRLILLFVFLGVFLPVADVLRAYPENVSLFFYVGVPWRARTRAGGARGTPAVLIYYIPRGLAAVFDCCPTHGRTTLPKCLRAAVRCSAGRENLLWR